MIRIIWPILSLALFAASCGKQEGPEASGAKGSQPAPSAVSGQQDKLAPNRPTFKVESFELKLKWENNPFDFRERILKKNLKIETRMFPATFVDEGGKAVVFDKISGFFCRVDGSEFSKIQGKGVVVVVGDLAEDVIQLTKTIGLNNCQYVSEGDAWEPKVTYEELLR